MVFKKDDYYKITSDHSLQRVSWKFLELIEEKDQRMFIDNIIFDFAGLDEIDYQGSVPNYFHDSFYNI